MRARSERHVRCRRAVDVEAVGLRVVPLVAVRRSDEDIQFSPGRDIDAGQPRIPDTSARQHHQRRLPAQPFLDRGAAQLGLPHDFVELVRMREQREQQVAERAIGGLDPGGEQENEEGEDVVVGEAL